MLQQSVLGRVYTCWTESAIFRLVRKMYRACLGAVQGSVLLKAVFFEGRLEEYYRASAAARLVRGFCGLLMALLAHFRVLYAAAEGSRILAAVRGSVLRVLLSFEGLFGAFVCVMFITPHDYWNNLYAVIAAVGFFLFYLFLTAIGKRKWVSPELLGLGALLFALAVVLSLGFSAAPMDSLRIVLFFFASLLFCYVVAADFRDPAKLRTLLGFLYLALLIVGAVGVVQHAFHLVKASSSYTDLELNVGVPGRVFATLNNPNNLSEFVLLFLPLGAAFAAGAKKPRQRIVLCAGLLIPALALLYTYSRAGWLAIVLAAAVFTYCCNKRLIPALAVLGVMAIPFLPASVMTRLSTIGNRADSSTQHRLDIWNGVLHMLRDYDRVITGIGLGPETFRILYPFYSIGTAKIGAYQSQMQYMELVLELGILGFVSSLYMVCKYAGRAVQAIVGGVRENRLVLIACLSSLAALAFVGLVEYLWFYQRLMFAFFLFLGILLAAAGGEDEKGFLDTVFTSC